MKRVIMRNLRGTIFYIKTNVLQDFRFCMSVPLKEKVINCMPNGKGTTICLIAGLLKKTSYKNESILS